MADVTLPSGFVLTVGKGTVVRPVPPAKPAPVVAPAKPETIIAPFGK